ncbi:MAG TPA: LuxR C-terminal-related transcriptional regulator [Acidimicrobiales bacterium]|nr:LuxR C-terminal-related transcriptional regulator [Acidimicrobiales bacterium]
MPLPRDVSGRDFATAIDAMLEEFEHAVGQPTALDLLPAIVDLYDAGRRLPLPAQRAIAPLLGQLELVVDRLVEWADAANGERAATDGGRGPEEGGVLLTPAEQRVLELLPTHLSMAEIGEELCLSRNTVKTHAIAAYRKLGVTSRSGAVRRARELGALTTQGGLRRSARYSPVLATSRPSATARWSAS